MSNICKIIDVDTRISNKQLLLDIILDNSYSPLRLSFEVLKMSMLGIKSRDIPNIVGLTVEIIDQRKNHLFERAFKICFDKPLSQMSSENINDYNYEVISDIKVSYKIPQKPFVIVKTENNNVYFEGLEDFCSRVDLAKDFLHLIEGVSIAPIMFKKGDTSYYNGRYFHIKEDNKIVRKWNFSYDLPLEKNYMEYCVSKRIKNFDYDETNRGLKSDKYGGYNDWDDDLIDDVFNGDPDATWNVD